MNDPHAQGLLPESFLEHGLLAAEYLHGQPVLGRFEDGHKTRQDARPDSPGTAALVAAVNAGGQAVRSGGGGVGGVRIVGAAAGITRVLREIRVSRRLHGGSHRRQLTAQPGHWVGGYCRRGRLLGACRARHCGGQNETENTRNVVNGTRRTDETIRGRHTYVRARDILCGVRCQTPRRRFLRTVNGAGTPTATATDDDNGAAVAGAADPDG